MSRAPTTIVENGRGASLGEKVLCLVVVGPETFFSRPLPSAGELTIGRSDKADVRLTDPLSSRLHARLHVRGGGIEIEDLGSANKTRLRDQPLKPGKRVSLVPGDTVAIGSTLLTIQENRDFSRPRRVWPHSYFEARLEEECVRAREMREPFAAMRLHCQRDSVEAAVIVEAITPALRVSDMLALYGPAEYELLLPGTPPELATALASDLVSRLKARGIEAQTGVVCFPRDAGTPDALLALANARLRVRAGVAEDDAGPVVVRDEGMRRMFRLAESAAVGNINVLIMGETGVGKEIVAQAIHRMSPRAKAPLLCINCAALSENLLESELFGHDKGAFTGAVAAKEGLLETADGGTVFLDEIGEMPPAIQAKLLRVIESRVVRRVGGLRDRAIDVRFVAATNRQLEREVAERRFRQDLYFRLNGFTLPIPPLRERTSEILPLARSFLAQTSKQLGRARPPKVTEDAEALLESYSWPGNVRELRNVMERAALLCGAGDIEAEHLPAETMSANPASLAPPVLAAQGSDSTPPLAHSEHNRILQALARHAGNQTRVARELGISRGTLIARLKQYGIARPRTRGR